VSDTDAQDRPEAAFQSLRARNLSFAKENSAFNRDWFLDLRRRVEAGEPLAFVNADVPTEIFKAMDIPVVVNQWWASVVAAKQKSAEYLGALNAEGYRQNLCKYCSLSYASTFEGDPAAAPWGGLPRPSLVVSGNDCNSLHKVFELWSTKFDIPFFRLERAAPDRPQRDGWLDNLEHGWEEVFGARVIDFLADQYRELIAFLETATGKRFDLDRFREVMRLVNEQEDYYRRTRDLIAASRPAPLNVADQMPATMIPQWHRGTEWARDRARLFYEETRARVDAGVGAAPNERVRLMWLGTGLWYNLDFYEYFQTAYGAVFVWSIYLAIAADAYPTYGPDPLRALAGRMTKIYALLNTAPFNVEWFAHEAARAGIDGVVSLTGGTEDDCRETFGQHYLVRRAFEAAGVPILRLGVDNADARTWDDAAIRARVSAFIEDEILAKRDGGRPAGAEAVR
jgi:benzoyl-CoA reductase/2-hydroxyglutaryl-CoA dehydratase subunit BcrC/BadD/HgdB